ncbi:MAG: queuosine precursor transporter [Cyanobacteria bacterium]|nr:queuosine precursor transporter [Cyanobacteriota bacterium]MDA1020847.1 queuosine precursor transporter [Cyanobacteriota bacterium]
MILTQRDRLVSMLERKHYKYLETITICFVLVLILSNLIGSVKITQLCLGQWFCFSTTTGVLLFPVSYLIGDILTEVYGYAQSRKVIWTGFGALILANLIIQFFIILPADPNWGLQGAYSQVFNMSLRISVASIIAFAAGEFTNSYVIAKLKLWTKGKYQSVRIIGSTMAGELVDTIIIIPLAFIGADGYPLELMFKLMGSKYLIKVIWEILAYPLLTVHLIRFLKNKEHEDYYDKDTDFNPFHL